MGKIFIPIVYKKGGVIDCTIHLFGNLILYPVFAICLILFISDPLSDTQTKLLYIIIYGAILYWWSDLFKNLMALPFRLIKKYRHTTSQLSESHE